MVNEYNYDIIEHKKSLGDILKAIAAVLLIVATYQIVTYIDSAMFVGIDRKVIGD